MKSRRPYSADNLLYKSRLEDYNFVTTVEETTTCEGIGNRFIIYKAINLMFVLY